MAKVKWADGIEYVSGLMTKRPKAGSMHSDHSTALLATHRVAATTNPNCTRLYMVGPYKRSTVPQAKELAARSRFASVAAAVKARSKDLMQQATDILPLEGLRRRLRRCVSWRLIARAARESLTREALFLYKIIQTIAYIRKKL